MKINQQQGVGLIEIMISLLIGVFIMAGMLSLFTGNKRTYLYQQSQALESDSQRFGATFFTTMFHQIGHTPISPDSLYGKHIVFSEQVDSEFAKGQVITGSADSIVYRYSAGENIVTCQGVDFPAEVDASGAIIRAERIETISLTTEGLLVCTGTTINGGTSTDDSAPVVVMGDVNVPMSQQLMVESLEINYGVDTNGDGSVDRFDDGTGVEALELTKKVGLSEVAVEATDEINGWHRVKIVNVLLTLKSGGRTPQVIEYSVALANLLETS